MKRNIMQERRELAQAARMSLEDWPQAKAMFLETCDKIIPSDDEEERDHFQLRLMSFRSCIKSIDKLPNKYAFLLIGWVDCLRDIHGRQYGYLRNK